MDSSNISGYSNHAKYKQNIYNANDFVLLPFFKSLIIITIKYAIKYQSID